MAAGVVGGVRTGLSFMIWQSVLPQIRVSGNGCALPWLTVSPHVPKRPDDCRMPFSWQKCAPTHLIVTDYMTIFALRKLRNGKRGTR